MLDELKKLVTGQHSLLVVFLGYWFCGALGMLLISIVLAGMSGFIIILVMLALRPVLCLLILSGVIHQMAIKITIDNLIVFAIVFTETSYWAWNITDIMMG